MRLPRNSVVSVFVLHPSAVTLGAGVLLSLAASLTLTAVGMAIDLARPLLDWTNPQKAIKQNLNVLVEAMACGCPAVSFDCETGPRDIIRHGVDGLLVSPKDGVEGLATSLRSLFTNGPLRRSMAAKASEIRQVYSIEAIKEKWHVLFKGGLC